MSPTFERNVDRRQALGDVMRFINTMQRWGLEWEWMAEFPHGEYIKRDELVLWLKEELSK